MTGDPLTREEFDALPEGSAVSIVWSGGNGPSEWDVRRRYGEVEVSHVSTRHLPDRNRGWEWIQSLGVRPLTEVRLVSKPE